MALTGNQKVIWSNNGEFLEVVQVFVRLNEDGSFEVLKSTADGKEIPTANTTVTETTAAPGASNETSSTINGTSAASNGKEENDVSAGASIMRTTRNEK